MPNTVALIFDFDDTLAPDTTSSLLNSVGVDVKRFWNDDVHKLIQDGWDPVPAYLYRMIEMSQSGEIEPITRDKLVAWASQLSYYPGVESIFDRLRAYAKEINPSLQLEFYLISSGIATTLRHTSIAKNFEDIWACDFSYKSDGTIQFPKNVVSFTDKTRYIFHISKGIYGKRSKGRPFDVNRKISQHDLRVPVNQMIFVGDGYTDIPCFSLVRKGGGIAIGVYDRHDREQWGRAWGFIEQQRVSNLVPADYTENSALTNSLVMALESMSRKIELHHLTYQG